MKLFVPLLCCCFSTVPLGTSAQSTVSPNIVFFLADDLGFNDVPWNNPSVQAPTLSALAARGTVLKWFYTEHNCVPSRSALMTGRYPKLREVFSGSREDWGVNKGSGGDKNNRWQARGLRTGFKLLPEYLQELGYSTHMIGKWHLGFCNQRYLPTRRGFQSFYGFFLGGEDYYTHVTDRMYDFFANEELDYSANGTYSTALFSKHAEQLIQQHVKQSQQSPLFLYVAFQNIHTPSEVPSRYINANRPKSVRRVAEGSILAMDEAIARVLQSLEDNQMTENTIIVFASDNGGSICHGGNNYPLRGQKWELWEGGTRVPALVVNPLNPSLQGRTFEGLFHMSDWLPTLLSAATGTDIKGFSSIDDTDTHGNFDGINQWGSFASNNLNTIHPRTEVLHWDEQGASLRVGDLKLVHYPVRFRSPGAKPPQWQELNLIEEEDINHCNKIYKCFLEPTDNQLAHALFNITADPWETQDLLDDMRHSEVTVGLFQRLDQLMGGKTPWLKKFTEGATMPQDRSVIPLNWCNSVE